MHISFFFCNFAVKSDNRKTKQSPAPTLETSQAGQLWKIEDDLPLRELSLEGKTITQLTKEFNRTQGAIRSRLKKLGLV